MKIFGLSYVSNLIKRNAVKAARKKRVAALNKPERFKPKEFNPDVFIPTRGSNVVCSGPDKYGRFVETYDNGVTVINQKNGGKIYEEWIGKSKQLVVLDRENNVVSVRDKNRKIIYCPNGSQIEITSAKNSKGENVDNFVTMYTPKYPDGISMKTHFFNADEKYTYVTDFRTGKMRVCTTDKSGNMEITSIDNFLKKKGSIHQDNFEPQSYPSGLMVAIMKGLI